MQLVLSTSLECGDLSPLWPGDVAAIVPDQSGDESPHSKEASCGTSSCNSDCITACRRALSCLTTY
jgi:hypothetical protein